MSQTVILGTARTPFTKMGGALSSKSAIELGGTAIAAALERSEVAPDEVEQVVFGQVLQAGQGQIPSRQAQIQAGALRALAVTTAKRFPLLPDLPTIAESGYPGFEALAWNGVLVAANTPRPIIERLNGEMNAILKESDVKPSPKGSAVLK